MCVYLCMCVYVCMCTRVRVCACTCVRMCVHVHVHGLPHGPRSAVVRYSHAATEPTQVIVRLLALDHAGERQGVELGDLGQQQDTLEGLADVCTPEGARPLAASPAGLSARMALSPATVVTSVGSSPGPKEQPL